MYILINLFVEFKSKISKISIVIATYNYRPFNTYINIRACTGSSRSPILTYTHTPRKKIVFVIFPHLNKKQPTTAALNLHIHFVIPNDK